ncbi:MAG TPA: hypothetical protein VFJ57_08710 [Solirubrobacterales bacterium]|nr:hypothetical protein [Solirubrobacterales bacterium]
MIGTDHAPTDDRRVPKALTLVCCLLAVLVAVPAAQAAPPLIGQWPLEASGRQRQQG